MVDKIFLSQVEIYKLRIPLIAPFITSLGRDDSAENIVVVIRTNAGISGFGECSPYMPINGESIETCFIVAQYFAKLLRGKNLLEIEDCIIAMDKFIYGNASIKSAFDMALYDIASQNASVPLYKFLGGENNKSIITDYTVSIGDPQKMAADALKIKEDRFPAIKVKLGTHGPTDVLRIKTIREAVGNEIPLRIDANQGWEVEEAIATLNALAPFAIQYCEEPISRWNFMELPRVKNASSIKIMADECCGDEHDAQRLIQLNACDLMNIKLGKSGGIFKALKMVRLAEAAKIHLQIGAFMESRLAMTAFAHFSLSSPIIQHFDFDTALMFKEDPINGGIVYEKNGTIHITNTAGLGATIEQSYLDKLEKIIV